jgi:hypothetical protein
VHLEIQPAALTPWRAILVVGAVFAVLTAQDWRRWTDAVIDFGAALRFESLGS